MSKQSSLENYIRLKDLYDDEMRKLNSTEEGSAEYEKSKDQIEMIKDLMETTAKLIATYNE